MQITFLNAAGTVLFVRDDMEQGNWTHEEYTVNATFPYVEGKVLERGMRLCFRNHATNGLEFFEIRNVTTIEPEHYQQIIAEGIVVSELSDEHCNTKEITDNTAEQALTTVLSGTLWSVGTCAFATAEEIAAISASITALGLNGNVDLENRPIVLPETMHEAGYTDFDGDYATLYSMTYTDKTKDNQMCTMLFTPIKTDGTVLTQANIDTYVSALCAASNNMSALKGNDTEGLLMHVLSGEQISAMEAIAESAHDLSDEWERATVGELSSVNIARGSVWQAVNSISKNWNAYITPRVTVNTAGSITGRYLDIAKAQGTWRGVRLSIDKNMSDASVVYDDSGVLTAMYGYGGNVDVSQTTGDDQTEELTFADVVWTATAGHPAKPDGQTYLEDPAKTALYGRNGRARFGYYQNGDINDAETLLEKTWEALQIASEPKISITGTVSDLYRLGYADQPLQLHDIALVEIQETGELLTKEIIKLDEDLLDPTATRPEIGDYIPNIVYYNRETEEKASGGGGGGGHGQTNEEDYQAKTYSGFDKTTDMIAMVVGMKDGDAYIKAGQIALAINGSTGETEARIDADKIYLNGETQVSALLSGAAEFLILKTSQLSVTLQGNAKYWNVTDGLTVEGHNATYKTVVINGTTYHLLGYTN